MRLDSTLNYKRNYDRMMNNYKNSSPKELKKGLGQKMNEGEDERSSMIDLIQDVFNSIVEENEKLKDKSFMKEDLEDVN